MQEEGKTAREGAGEQPAAADGSGEGSTTAGSADSRLERLLGEAVPGSSSLGLEHLAAEHPSLGSRLRECVEALDFLAQARRGPARPAQLGDFRILREIGRGGMGVVYESEQLSLGRRVALKVLPHGPALDPRQLARFQVEARAAARLHHSNIVPVYAVGSEGGVPGLGCAWPAIPRRLRPGASLLVGALALVLGLRAASDAYYDELRGVRPGDGDLEPGGPDGGGQDPARREPAERR